LPVTEIVPLDLEFEDGLSTEKLLARLTGVFGALTLAVAALGFYGLLSFRVARRTSEIGIRMAMGATRSQVQGLFLSQTLTILLAGVIPGIAMALGLHSLAGKLMYETETTNPMGLQTDLQSLALAIVLLMCVGILATLLPARRAASIDPMQALRSE
jgi:ABC-type antimicrobial peptide transport system permease subunit